MYFMLMVLNFLFKLRFPKNSGISDILRKRYGSPAVCIFRNLQNATFKVTKCELDIHFLSICKAYGVVPKFMRFKLYKQSLHRKKFYKNWQLFLLTEEIKCTKLRLNNLQKKLYDCEVKFNRFFTSTIDHTFLKCNISKINFSTINSIKDKHKQKLARLGITNDLYPIEKSLFNYSNKALTRREKYLLSLGLDFKLPVRKINHISYFSSFESLVGNLKPYITVTEKSFEEFCSKIKYLALNFYEQFSYKDIINPIIKKEDIHSLKKLAQDSSIIISRPDKGKGTVILNKTDYINKMNNIVNDSTKFIPVNTDIFQLNRKLEDSINSLLRNFKNKNISAFEQCYVSGTQPGKLYGLPKVHKSNVPLRPVLSACNTATFKLAKNIVNILEPITYNDFSIKNSYAFVKELSGNPDLKNYVMVSYDVESLFTSIPVNETIEIILNKLFTSSQVKISELDRNQFLKLLQTVTKNTYFVFNKIIFFCVFRIFLLLLFLPIYV